MNDQLISFWVEHLRIHIIQPQQLNVVVLPPNISYFLALSQDETDLNSMFKDFKLKEKDLIIVTVNDSSVTEFDDISGPVGTHWSLLAYEKRSNTFAYLDSLQAHRNWDNAYNLTSKLRALLDTPHSQLVQIAVPSQKNMYDCGKFLVSLFHS